MDGKLFDAIKDTKVKKINEKIETVFVSYSKGTGDVKDKAGNVYIGADWKDTEGLLDVISEELGMHGLKLILGDRGDDNWWVAIVKK